MTWNEFKRSPRDQALGFIDAMRLLGKTDQEIRAAAQKLEPVRKQHVLDALAIPSRRSMRNEGVAFMAPITAAVRDFIGAALRRGHSRPMKNPISKKLS